MITATRIHFLYQVLDNTEGEVTVLNDANHRDITEWTGGSRKHLMPSFRQLMINSSLARLD